MHTLFWCKTWLTCLTVFIQKISETLFSHSVHGSNGSNREMVYYCNVIIKLLLFIIISYAKPQYYTEYISDPQFGYKEITRTMKE